jgi:hypothetical protein
MGNADDRFGRGVSQVATPIWIAPHDGDPGRNRDAVTGSAGLCQHPYERHQPEQTLLYQLVETHYPALVDQLAQQGRKAFMIRTIRPLDRPDPRLERVAKANGFSRTARETALGCKHERLFTRYP